MHFTHTHTQTHLYAYILHTQTEIYRYNYLGLKTTQRVGSVRDFLKVSAEKQIHVLNFFLLPSCSNILLSNSFPLFVLKATAHMEVVSDFSVNGTTIC